MTTTTQAEKESESMMTCTLIGGSIRHISSQPENVKAGGSDADDTESMTKKYTKKTMMRRHCCFACAFQDLQRDSNDEESRLIKHLDIRESRRTRMRRGQRISLWTRYSLYSAMSAAVLLVAQLAVQTACTQKVFHIFPFADAAAVCLLSRSSGDKVCASQKNPKNNTAGTKSISRFLLPSSTLMQSLMATFGLVILAILVCITSIVLYNTEQQRRRRARQEKLHSRQMEEVMQDGTFQTARERIMSTKGWYASVLSKAIQLRTVSYDPHDMQNEADDEDESTSNVSQTEGTNPLPAATTSKKRRNINEERDRNLLKMHELLRTCFPLLHKKYPPLIINKYSLLFKIKGSDPTLKPIMLCAHLDVVPAPTSEEWTKEPFSGDIDEKGVIWGRGAIDNKHNVIGQLGALEDILATHKADANDTNSEILQRTLYVALGHDEEIGGHDGAQHIAQHLLQKEHMAGQFEAVFDEGTMMVSGGIPGMPKTEHVALIGTCEKGMVNVELSLRGPGGHSSMPSIDGEGGLISVMGRAVSRLERTPVASQFGPNSPFRKTLTHMACHLSVPMNVICANLWLFGPLIQAVILRSSAAAAALIRTTTAVCKIRGGTKMNVLPHDVTAEVNHRVHPLDTVESVLNHDRRIINDDRVQLKLLPWSIPPSPQSSYDTDAYRWIEKCVKLVFDNNSAPTVLGGNTDTRWYWDLTNNIYRFSPIALTLEETKMFHGLNERISSKALAEMVLFYRMFILTSSCEKAKKEDAGMK